MKRSQINAAIRDAEAFFASHRFVLPPPAGWSTEEWRRRRDEAREAIDCRLGWDVTDFGRGNFEAEGLLLFTLRNGRAGDPAYPKSYAEKIMISRCGQKTLTHCHRHKREDIINRGGGILVFELAYGDSDHSLSSRPVIFSRDGLACQVAGGDRVALRPGESITLEPWVYHSFWAEDGDVLIGEVSAVNDDCNDNLFYGRQLRFPEIEEDQPVYRLTVADYDAFFASRI